VSVLVVHDPPPVPRKVVHVPSDGENTPLAGPFPTLQVSVDVCPFVTSDGLAERVHVGGNPPLLEEVDDVLVDVLLVLLLELLAGGFTTITNDLCTVVHVSESCTTKLYVPAVVVVPEITPVDPFNERFNGKDPEVMLHVYELLPPEADNVVDGYEEPSVPDGRYGVLIASGLGLTLIVPVYATDGEETWSVTEVLTVIVSEQFESSPTFGAVVL
jgi:hypothetical protein